MIILSILRPAARHCLADGLYHCASSRNVRSSLFEAFQAGCCQHEHLLYAARLGHRPPLLHADWSHMLARGAGFRHPARLLCSDSKRMSPSTKVHLLFSPGWSNHPSFFTLMPSGPHSVMCIITGSAQEEHAQGIGSYHKLEAADRAQVDACTRGSQQAGGFHQLSARQ